MCNHLAIISWVCLRVGGELGGGGGRGWESVESRCVNDERCVVKEVGISVTMASYFYNIVPSLVMS